MDSAAATEPASSAGLGTPGIRQGHRILAAGMPGMGKSELGLHLFAIHSGQRLLIDVQDHYELGPAAKAEGAIVVDRPSDIDWRVRTIRYVPRSGSQREYEELYAAIFNRGHMLVVLDEALGPTTAHSCPVSLRRTVTQGRKRAITHVATYQRVHGIERTLIAQSEHVFLFRMVDPDDIAALSYRVGLSKRELADVLVDLPDHAYLRHSVGMDHVLRMPPLPASVVQATRRHVVNP